MTAGEKTRNRRRIWLYRIIAALVFPFLLIAAIEMALRLFGLGYPSQAFLKIEAGGTSLYCDNYRFAFRYFPAEIAREFDPFTFAARKGERTCRIFVLGASAAQGTPDGSFCFGRFLEVMLEDRHPGVDFEVITAAMPAINSHAVLEIGKECLDHEPDLLLVYCGNNEVVGPYGAGTVFSPLKGDLSSIRFGLALRTFRIGQVVAGFAGAAESGGEDLEVWGGMKMFLEKQVARDDPRLETVYVHFKQNLLDLGQAARAAKCPILFSTVAVNLMDHAPFASLHREDLQGTDLQIWDLLFEEGKAFEAAGDFEEAIHSYQAASRVDDSFAELCFREGRCCLALGKIDEARACFLAARDADTLRFRADSDINRIIAEIAQEGEFVDAAAAIEAASPGRIPGRNLFFEHVHLRPLGNFLVARAFLPQVEAFLPAAVSAAKDPGAEDPDFEKCARTLAFTPWDRFRLDTEMLNNYIMKPPFVNRLDHEEELERWKAELRGIMEELDSGTLRACASIYTAALQKRPADWWLHWRYAQLLARDLGNPKAAAAAYRKVQELLPHSYKGDLGLGTALGSLGEDEQAIESTLKALEMKPDSLVAHHNLAIIYERQGELEKALSQFRQAMDLKPGNIQARTNLAMLLVRMGRREEGLEVLREGMGIKPGNVELHFILAKLLSQAGRKEDAAQEYRAILEIDPESSRALEALENL